MLHEDSYGIFQQQFHFAYEKISGHKNPTVSDDIQLLFLLKEMSS